MKKQTPKKRTPKTRTKTTYEKIGSALARVRDLASSLTSSPETNVAPRATDLLIEHHREVEKLFDRLESPKGFTDATLRRLADELTAHIAIEEKLFYPAVRKLDPDVIFEGLEEHAMGRFALLRLLGTKSNDHSLKARMKALKELMTNHHKEEEDELFPKARKEMSNDALHELGASMKKLFDADVKRGHEAVLASFHDVMKKPVRARSPKRAKTKKA